MDGWKPLLPFDGSTIIETVVKNALAVCARVIVVSGYRADELAPIFENARRVAVIHNPHWKEGMLSSILTGMREIQAKQFFLIPGDMPYVQSAVYRSLLQAHHAEVTYPEYQGRRGHPVLIQSRAIDTIHKLSKKKETLRDILRSLEYSVAPWHEDTILRDIDTPVDYRRGGAAKGLR